jgi:HK97 family phage prohead protease
MKTKDTGGFGLAVKNSAIVLDVKAVKDDGMIEGYGSVFGVIDSYREVVEPGAFMGSLAKRKARGIKMLWQHDPSQPIGVWDDIAEDSKGLWVKGRLLKDVSPRAAEAHGLLREGALDGLSIGYREIKAEQHPDKPGVVKLLELDLREVSIVTFAANERARVETVKSILAGGELPTVRQFEEFLRDAGGFSKSLAAAIAGKAAPHLRRESEAKASDAAAFLQAMLRG